MSSVWQRVSNASGGWDSLIGPQFGDQFDLTLLFEDAILTILPSALLILLSPVYMFYYISQPTVAAEKPLQTVKLSACAVLFIFELIAAVFGIGPNDSTDTAAAASVLSCVAGVVIAALIQAEHRHATQASALVGLYLGVTTLLDAVKVRTYFRRDGTNFYILGGLSAAAVASKLLLLVLTEVPTRFRSLGKSELGKEATRGFWNRTLFVWLNSTLLLGFSNALSVDHLPSLGPSFGSARNAAALEAIWFKSKRSSIRLMKASIRSQLWEFLAAVPPRLLFSAFMFTQPFLLRRILQYVDDEDKSAEVRNGLIGATALTYIGVALSRVWFMHMNNRLITKTRGLLISQILRKNMLLDYGTATGASALTLMSTDVDGIARSLPRIHEAWAAVIELGVGVYLLSTITERASFLVLIPATISTAISVEIGIRSEPAFRAWNKKTEERVAKTAKILSQIKGIKMMAGEYAIADYIQSLREAEISFSKKARKLTVLTQVVAPLGYTFTPIIVIAGGIFWSGFDDGFNATEAFTSLAFTSLASKPIMTILLSWSRLGGVAACFGRIQDFLELEERHDSRKKSPRSQEKPLASSSKEKSLHDDQSFAMQLVDAAVSFTKTDRPMLHGSAQFNHSTVTTVIGRTGSGKSTLLNALLGETALSAGSCQVYGKQQLAYCHQDTWLRNITIRDNIIGESVFKLDLYKAVINACGLHDIEKLPKGDLSLAGSRGANLSGGQKQRIALARAVYSQAPILILDDVFSSVDQQTSAAILENLLGPDGLLRKAGSTVIMSTHIVEHLKFSDQTLVLEPDGSITIKSGQEAINHAIHKLPVLNNKNANACDPQVSLEPAPPQPKEETDTPLRQSSDFSLYKYYLKSVSIWALSVWILFTVFVAIMERMPDIFVRIWLDRNPANKLYFVGYALFGAGGMASIAIWTWSFYIYLVPESSERLHRRLLDTVTGATLSFLTSTDSGKILNRFSQDMSMISQDLPLAFLFFLYTLFTVATDIVVVSSATRYTAVILPFIIIFLLGIQHFYLRTSRQMRLLDLEAKTPLYTHFTETSDGLQHIRAFRWEQNFVSKGLELLDRSQKPFYYMYCIQSWLSLVLDLTVAALAVALVSLALCFGAIKQAALGLALLNTMQMGPRFANVLNNWVDLETSLGSISRLKTFTCETPSEEAEIGAQQCSEAACSLSDNWPNRGNVEFKDVSSEYITPGGSHAGLRRVSFEIEGGTKVGIVGRTGSGKTSLLLTLLNFLKYTGTIFIDDVDISTVSRRQLRSRITTISQDLLDLPSSIRDNLSPHDMTKSPDAGTDAVMYEALAKVGLVDHVKSRGGLDRPMDDAGLSQGQKQLLAIARALIQVGNTKSKLVLVDEATSSVDYECEERMQAVMDDVFADCTILAIAHRPRTVQDAQVVLELSQGRLVQSD